LILPTNFPTTPCALHGLLLFWHLSSLRIQRGWDEADERKQGIKLASIQVYKKEKCAVVSFSRNDGEKFSADTADEADMGMESGSSPERQQYDPVSEKPSCILPIWRVLDAVTAFHLGIGNSFNFRPP